MPEDRFRIAPREHGRRLFDLLRDTRVDAGLLASVLLVLTLTLFGSAQGDVELLRSGAGLPTIWTDTATAAADPTPRTETTSLDLIRPDRSRRPRGGSSGIVEEVGDEALTLSRSSITLTSIGDTAAITASLGKLSTVVPRFTPGEEVPWIAGESVLDAGALEEGRLVARAPGRVELRVRAFGRGPEILTVRVVPGEPTTLSLRAPRRVRPGDTVRVLGYRMGEVDPADVRLDGEPATVVGRDSASLEILAPPAPDSDACRGSSRTEITVEGVRASGELAYFAAREGEVALSVGESLRLPDATSCLKLSADPDAEYVLAYFDRSPVDRPETPAEIDEANSLYRHTSDPARVPPVTISVGDRSGENGARSADRRRDSDDPAEGAETPDAEEANDRSRPNRHSNDPFTITVASGEKRCGANDYREGCGEVFDRNRPWELGDRFLITDPDDSRVLVAGGDSVVAADYARVVEVRDRIVYAVYEHDERLFTPEWSAAFDRAVDALHRDGIPYLQSILSRRHPVTSRGSGQLLVILAELDGPVMGRSFTGVNGSGSNAEAHALIDLANEPTVGTLYQVLAHEMAHAWNAQYRFEHDIPLGTHYHEEGLAEFLANELMRRDAGISITGDWEGWKTSDSSTTAGQYGREARAQQGLITKGYVGLSGFYRDLVVRRMEEGESLRGATRAVVRGAHENWSGLTRRMRELFPGWKPVDGILTWTLSQAADDRLASGIFRNTSFRSVSAAAGSGWQPVGTVVAGEGERRIRRDARYGSAGFFYLEDAIGGSFRLETSGTRAPGARGWGVPSDVAWMLLRVR